MLSTTTPYHQPLDEHLVIKSVSDTHDAERLAIYDGQIFGELVAGMTRQLILHHPATRPEHWLYVQDTQTGTIVSSLGLIPWQWRYEDVTLKSAEMAIVSTDPHYRKRGLIRALVKRFNEILYEESFDLSHIQGIPYFYRQFGYEYAIPLEPLWHLNLDDVPDVVAPMSITLKPATPDDIPILIRLYNATTQPLHIAPLRDALIWDYLLNRTAETEMQGHYYLIHDADAQPLGYIRTMDHSFGWGLSVSEASPMSHPLTQNVLVHLKAIVQQQDKSAIRFNLPESSDLLQEAISHGAQNTRDYAWQILIPDVVRLMQKIAPILEQRIANSRFHGLTRNIQLDLFREGIELQFEKGKLIRIHRVVLGERNPIRIPPHLLTPLVLGYRNRSTLDEQYHDFSVRPSAHQIMDTLFPQLDSFIYTMY